MNPAPTPTPVAQKIVVATCNDGDEYFLALKYSDDTYKWLRFFNNLADTPVIYYQDSIFHVDVVTHGNDDNDTTCQVGIEFDGTQPEVGNLDAVDAGVRYVECNPSGKYDEQSRFDGTMTLRFEAYPEGQSTISFETGNGDWNTPEDGYVSVEFDEIEIVNLTNVP